MFEIWELKIVALSLFGECIVGKMVPLARKNSKENESLQYPQSSFSFLIFLH
jgi:hypothetical protein